MDFKYYSGNEKFIPPVNVSLKKEELDQFGGETYSNSNYLKSGLASKLRKRHFEICLSLVSPHFYKYNVIDFGCADGSFIPSLSKYFNHVVGFDVIPHFIDTAKKVVKEMELTNVDLICNKEMDIPEIKSILNKEYDIAFCLEVLEHVGDNESMYKPKIDLLKDIQSLISEDGIIIVSVPKMVGLSFMVQRLGFYLLNQKREYISFKNLIKAGIFKDTSDLEKNWHHFSHLGFNHEILEKEVSKHFKIVTKINDFFQVVYVIKPL